MKAIRNTSIIISAIFIAATTIIWMGVLLQKEEFHFKNFIQSALLVGGIDLFYALIIWFPYHYKESRYVNVITYTAFSLSLLPVLFIFFVIHLLSQWHC